MAKQRQHTIRHLDNFEYPYLASWDKSATNITFDIANIHYSTANALRRIMISELATLAFKDKPHAARTVHIITNNSPLNNEQLAHRIALIPVHIIHIDKFTSDDHLFILDITNATTDLVYITSRDFKVKHIPTNKFLSADAVAELFPPDPLTGDYSIITVLKGTSYSGGVPLKLYVEAKLVNGNCCIGTDNSHFSPVTVASYVNKVDPHLADDAREKYIQKHIQQAESKKITPDPLDLLKRKFDVNERARSFHVNDRGEPNLFTFQIETVGVVPPLIIFDRALDYLKSKLLTFMNNMLNKNAAVITITPATHVQGFEFIVDNEDDTLGGIVQSHLCRMYADYALAEDRKLLSYIGYTRIHPAKRKIKILLSSHIYKSLDDILDHVIKPGCTEIIKMITHIQLELHDIKHYITELKSINSHI
jgi:hypothetical protein